MDDDVYYERAGTGEDVPFRVVTFEMLTASWMPFVFNLEWVRVTDASLLLPPREMFALTSELTEEEMGSAFSEVLEDLKPEVATMFTVTPEYDNDNELVGQGYVWTLEFDEFELDDEGRASLPASAFDPAALEVDLPDDIYQ